ncbi:MAG: hypothetical protein HGA87_02995 [Desulfobulbaceae bacterium]|nr:hypothetical protein [Desulfobulbaceae bacterium]
MSELKCSHIFEDGRQCDAYARTGKTLCFSHDPESREAKLEAVTKGGKANGVVEPLTPIEMKSLDDVVTLLIQTLNEVRSGAIEQKRATTVGFLCGQLLKAYQATRDTQQLDEIEAAFGIKPKKLMFRSKER